MYFITSIVLAWTTWIISSSALPFDSLLAPGILPRSAVKPTLTAAPVAIGAGTYPRATRLHDGSILGVYTAFESGSNVIRTSKSTNNGASWTPLGSVASGASNANDIDNPFAIQLPTSNRILVAFRNHSKDPSTGAYTYFRITVCYSDDGGTTWNYLSQPAGDAGPVQGSWEPFFRIAVDGSLQLYYSHENSAQDQDTLQRISKDGGATWSAAVCVSGSGITSRDGMTSVASLGTSKSLILVYETETTGVFSLGAVFSTDDGKTWSGRKTIYTAPNPNTSAGAPQVINVGGTLAVSFMTNEDSGLTSPSSSYTSNTAVKLITSGDLGGSWGNKITVGTVQSAWPGLMDLANGKGQFLYMLDKAGAKAQTITFT
ncbi:MAG: hypothetical protein Q9218_001556 [Villophora microphyllina]